MNPLADNLEQLEEAIQAACTVAGRDRGEIELMAVSKTYPAETLVAAAELGLRLFGENRVQEYATKADYLKKLCQQAGQPNRVHLIGHLQSNKTTRAVELFDGIDSVDSLKLAERLNDAAGKIDKLMPILLEVKLSREETKDGLDPESFEAEALLERLRDLEHLQVQGLMTIAPFGVSDDETRACFRELVHWRNLWAQRYPRLSFDVLSMGMSSDFDLAIAEGATRIRVGTSLFGQRSYPERD